jgi:hypothetical protein
MILRTLFVLPFMLGASVREASGDWPSQPTANLSVCAATGSQTGPKVVTDLAGGAIFIWSDSRGGAGETDLYASRVHANGAIDLTWPATGAAICSAPSSQSTFSTESDGSGGAFITWQDFRSAGWDVYAHHLLADGTVDPNWPPNGLAVCTAGGSQLSPQLAADGFGGMYVAWSDQRAGDRDVYVHHLLANGTTDPNWPVDGLLLATGPGDQTGPTLVVEGGGVMVVWADFGGTSPDIRCQRLLVNGAVDPTWPSGSLAVCSAAGTQQLPVAVSDGAGGVFVAWVDLRLGAADVYAAHVLSTGSLNSSWPADGRPLCTATGDQTQVRIASTGSGSAIVTWRDHRAATEDIYAQRIHGPAASWPVNGVALCVATGDQQLPAIASDGYGGAIVTWQDNRNTSIDVYAQRVLEDGGLAPGWPANGAAVTSAPLTQQSPSILDDGSGGAIVAWQDSRNGNLDIFAQRIQGNGQLGGTVVGVDDGPRLVSGLQRVRPNPWRMNSALQVDFVLAEPASVSIQLLDVTGRAVSEATLGGLGAGHHSATIRPSVHLSGGIYFVNLRHGELTTSYPLAILE